MIDYYAELVGALIGIAILILTMIIWVVVGPTMGFNSNWWVLIGTYAGWVGMDNGFVLEICSTSLKGYEDCLFGEMGWGDDDARQVPDSLERLPAQHEQQRRRLQLQGKFARFAEAGDAQGSCRAVCLH